MALPHIYLLYFIFPHVKKLSFLGTTGQRMYDFYFCFYGRDHVHKHPRPRIPVPLANNTKPNKTENTASSEFCSPALSILTS